MLPAGMSNHISTEFGPVPTVSVGASWTKDEVPLNFAAVVSENGPAEPSVTVL